MSTFKPPRLRALDLISLLTVCFFGLIAWDIARKPEPGSIILLVILGYIMLRIVYELTFNRDGVPTLPSGFIQRRKISGILKKDAASRGRRPYTIVDLGSGAGELTRHIARAMPQDRVTGIELSNIAHMRALVFQRLLGPRKNLEYRCQDFFTYDCAGVDAVVLYLRATYMERVAAKLRKELKPGALIISSTFRLPADWQLLETVTFHTPFKTELFVYRAPG